MTSHKKILSKKQQRLLAASLGCGVLAGHAAPYPPPWQSVEKEIRAYIQAQTRTLPDKVEIEMGAIDMRLRPPPCHDVAVSTPAGSRLWGASVVHLACRTGPAWQMNVPVQVHITGPVVVLAAPMAAGQVLATADLATRDEDITRLADGVIRSPADAVGKVMQFQARPGSVLRQQMLRLPWSIRQGAPVRVVAQGLGYSLATEGVAMNNASPGQMVRVRTDAGKTLTAVARDDGHAEITN